MYKTILVPHAGTSAGDEAVRHAIHLAKNDSAKIILLHVIEASPVPATFALAESERKKLVGEMESANNLLKETMEKNLEEQIKKCEEKQVQAEKIVVIGDAAEEILKITLKKDIDLIVMAKRRKLKGLKKLLSLGSVSRKVVEHVVCPVYLIDIEHI